MLSELPPALVSNGFDHQLETLRRNRFSGRLDIQSADGTATWYIFFYLGRIFFATGGIYPFRRWQRQFMHFGAAMERMNQYGRVNLPQAQYDIICTFVRQNVLTREQGVAIMQSLLDEIIFELLPMKNLNYRFEEDMNPPDLTMSALINTTDVLNRGVRNVQDWLSAGLHSYTPNQVPVLKWPELLRKKTSAMVFQSLKSLLDGKNTFWDLAVQVKLEVSTLARTLAPYIQDDIIAIAEIPDLPPVAPMPIPSNAPLIACVDDSPQICQTMEKILTGSGYRYFSVQDPLRGFTTLLQRRPDLIFLDLVMPNTNGYEICVKLRRTEAFRQTPIIILTGNDGIIDRVRAKLVRSSGFVSKPARSELLLNVVRTHLKRVQRLHG
jgi:two-component system, chemotaxis family, response regulator PixG